MPWGVAAAAIGAVGSAYSSQQQSKATQAGQDAQANQFALTQGQTRQYRQSGKRANRELDFLLGTGANELVSEDEWKRKQKQMLMAQNPYMGKRGLENKLNKKWEQEKTRREGLTSREGYGSLTKDFGAEDFKTDPGYQFRMSEGAKGVDRSAAARGGLLSGAAMKAMERYRQGFASNEYQNAYSREMNNRQNKYNMLTGQVATGLGQQNQFLNAGQTYANNYSNLAMQQGNANAAGTMGVTNSLLGGMGQMQGLMAQRAAGSTNTIAGG